MDLRRAGRLTWILGAIVFLAACSQAPAARNTPSALSPRGEGARIIAGEWWFQFALGSAIFVLVMAILAWIILRNRDAVRAAPFAEPELHTPPRGLSWIIWGGVVLPVAALSAVFAVSLSSMRALGEPPGSEAVTIEVIGHQWWWEVRYPDEGIVTANQIAVPAGEPVRVHLRTADVIHSFWVPELHHKLDLIPGQANAIWLHADEPGVYRGLCAEFCGLQHAYMHFLVVAMPRERYEAWAAHESSPAAQPEDPLLQLGQDVFLSSSCVYCHQIRGTPAAGSVGPDLTHLGSRLTLAAGILPNNRGNLGAWISDPQHIKPGAHMPPANLTGEELQALLAYLEWLR